MRRILCYALIITLQAVGTFEYQYHGAETELIALINDIRKANGVPALTISWEVARLARYRSEEMMRNKVFSHESLIYGNPAQLLQQFNIPNSSVGANIAMGHMTACEVINSWQLSPGHMANLLNSNYTSAGVGLSWCEDGFSYWTLILVGN